MFISRRRVDNLYSRKATQCRTLFDDRKRPGDYGLASDYCSKYRDSKNWPSYFLWCSNRYKIRSISHKIGIQINLNWLFFTVINTKLDRFRRKLGQFWPTGNRYVESDSIIGFEDVMFGEIRSLSHICENQGRINHEGESHLHKWVKM